MALLRTGVVAVIFDCDGTLVDSEPLARAAWERALGPYGYAIDDDEYAGLLGLPYRRVHGFFAERIPGLAPPELLWEDYAARLFALIDAQLEPFPDALATLAELRAGGIPVAVASSSPRARLDRTLARAGLVDAFAVSVAGDEVEHGKPAPDLLLVAAARLGADPRRCAVVEDTAPGIAAGRAAGMRTVGIARGEHDVGDADVVLDRLSAAAVLGAGG